MKLIRCIWIQASHFLMDNRAEQGLQIIKYKRVLLPQGKEALPKAPRSRRLAVLWLAVPTLLALETSTYS